MAQPQKEAKQVPAIKEWTVEYKSTGGVDIKLTPSIIKKYLIRGKPELLTDQEIVFFLKICQARGLNPFIGDAYLIKYSSDPAAIVTSVDFFRKRARAQKDCTGWEKGIIVQGKEGIRRSHGLVLEGEKLVGGWFKARPEGWKVDFEVEVNLNGYLKRTKEGKITKFWEEENQPTMIAKVAESQGLRQLWPDEFQGLHTEEEIGDEKELGNGSIDITPKSFDELLMGKDQTLLGEYFEFLIPYNKGKTIDDLKAGAAKDFENFWNRFEDWRKKQPKLETAEDRMPSPEQVEMDLKDAGMAG